MKARFEISRTVKPIGSEELKFLPTGSLLTRLNQLRSLQESFEVSDWLPDERDAVEATGLIAFKNSEQWKIAFSDVKRVLSEREHIPRGSKDKRRKAAHQKKNG
ncbi:hypothetical protein FEE96_18095 [Parasedimentitalea maritima]|uniref:Transposase n=1 Tax=Parasedimentitalea maritima TaxID=2578117 RepID=A0ABY2UT38_9RHOB|nr:hypothetical protein [Zongyanglinia marina]TLP58344.1 hypothetical protein FEE96_18095 [Zongyanglinia marina]